MVKDTSAPLSDGEKLQGRYSGLWLVVPAVVGISLFWPHQCGDGGLRVARETGAANLIRHLEQAIQVYQRDSGSFPEGDGRGSVGLVKRLQAPGPKRSPYFEFSPDDLDSAGNICSPLDQNEILHYRCPGLNHPKSFDLWCKDRHGRSDGINNWEK